MVGWRGLVLVGIALTVGVVGVARDAGAEQRPLVTVRVELPPGVKASDVRVRVTYGHTGDGPTERLDEDGTTAFDAARGQYHFVTISAGDKVYTTTLYVPRSGGARTLSVKASDMVDETAFYNPDAVYTKGKTARAAGDSAGAEAAAADLEAAAAANQRSVADFRQAQADELRDALSGLPPGFVDDFIRDFQAATTPEAQQQVVKRYAEGATLKAPDSLTSPEYKASRDAFLRLTKQDFKYDFAGERLKEAELDRSRAAELRGGPAAPPGHGFAPLGPGARPQFPGSVIPGVPAAPVEYVRFDRPNYWLQFGAGAAFFDAKPVGYGTLVTGVQGTEDYLAETGSRSTGYRLALDGGWDVCEGGWLVGHAAYRRAFYDANGFVPIGGQDVGVTYFDRAPNDSSGLDLGNTGAYTSVKGDIAKYEADFTYRVDLNKKFNWGGGGPRYNAGLGLAYRRFDLSYKARQTSPTFDGISSKAWIDSTTNIVGPRLEGGLSWTAQDVAPVKIQIQGYVIPGYRWGDGHAKQRSRCNLCPADEQNLKIVRERSSSGFGLVAGFTGRVAVDLTDDLQLGLEGGYEFTNGVNTWHVPKGPFEAPANLAPEPLKVGYVGINLRLSF